MNANTTTGHRVNLSGSKETKVLQQLVYWGNSWGEIVQDTTQTVEDYVGLSYTDAMSVFVSSEESVLNGVTRQRLGNAVLTSLGGAFIRCTACWGTKKSSQFSKMGETNLYQVTITTTEYTVRAEGAGMTLTLE